MAVSFLRRVGKGPLHYRELKICQVQTHHVPEQQSPAGGKRETITDHKKPPKTACGSPLTNKTVSTIFEGKKIYFCEKECLDEFNLNPEAFLQSDHFLIKWEDLESIS